MVAIIIKLVSNDDNSFKLALIIFLEDTKYMTILTRQERERLVLDLYNQGKTYREIAKEARISPRDIGVILKAVEDTRTEGSKGEQQENNNDAENDQEQGQQHSFLSTQAYKLFSEGKTPIEVAIELNLRESEATGFYKEYWKLKQLHNLNVVYEEIKDDIESFLKLYKLAKTKGMDVKQVVNTLAIANNNLPDIEWRYKRLQKEVNTLEFKKQQSHVALSYFKSQIEKHSKTLNFLRISCGRERIEIEKLCNEKISLEALVTEFKNKNEEYLKIKEAAYEEVISVLTNGKLLLRFATASVIESLRRNPELCNFVLNDISKNNNTTSGSDHLSLMSPGQQLQQSFSYLNNDIYSAVLLEESEKLYNIFITKLTNSVIAATRVQYLDHTLMLKI
jgi:transposase